jgi:hypothetical protein
MTKTRGLDCLASMAMEGDWVGALCAMRLVMKGDTSPDEIEDDLIGIKRHVMGVLQFERVGN